MKRSVLNTNFRTLAEFRLDAVVVNVVCRLGSQLIICYVKHYSVVGSDCCTLLSWSEVVSVVRSVFVFVNTRCISNYCPLQDWLSFNPMYSCHGWYLGVITLRLDLIFWNSGLWVMLMMTVQFLGMSAVSVTLVQQVGLELQRSCQSLSPSEQAMAPGNRAAAVCSFPLHSLLFVG